MVITSGSQISKLQLFASAGKIVCGNTYTTLESNSYPLVNYDWKLNGQTIPLSSFRTTSVVALQSGIYTLTLT